MGLFGPPNINKMEAKRDVEGLIKALRYRRDKKDEYRHVAQAAAEALGKIGDVRAIEPLIAALKDIDSSVCEAAAKSLGKIGDVRAIEPLIAALEVRHLDVEACVALRAIGAPAVEPLITALKHNNDHVRILVVSALRGIRDARAVEPLIAALKDTSFMVCEQAALALEHIGDVRAVEPLIAALKESSRAIRDDVQNQRSCGDDVIFSRWKLPLNAAAEALVTLGDFRAIEPLFAVLDDLDDKVQAGARALRQSSDVNAIETHQATLEQLNQAERTNESYVNECFTIEFPETRENRQLLDTAEAQPMIAAQRSGALADSLLHAQRLAMRYPDCHSFYYWQGYLHAELGNLGQSRAILLEGIQKSREKASLYDRLARTEWQTGDLQEAVKWWIRSMVVRTETRNFDDSDPFLYLWYVAEGLGLSDAAAKLSQKSKTSLGSEAAAKLRNAAVSQGTQYMKGAILRACRDLA